MNKQLLVTTTSSLKTLLNKVQAIAQNKTHGPDNPSHKDCSSRNSSNKRKKKNLNEKAQCATLQRLCHVQCFRGSSNEQNVQMH